MRKYDSKYYIHLCCYYLNLSALIWPYIFWQMLSYLRDRNALPFLWPNVRPQPSSLCDDTLPCVLSGTLATLRYNPIVLWPAIAQHAELYGDCLHAWGTWEHVKP